MVRWKAQCEDSYCSEALVETISYGGGGIHVNWLYPSINLQSDLYASTHVIKIGCQFIAHL